MQSNDTAGSADPRTDRMIELFDFTDAEVAVLQGMADEEGLSLFDFVADLIRSAFVGEI